MTLPLDEAPSLGEFFARIGEATEKRAITHGLHPYPAKFIPHIPRRLIAQFSRPGDVVLDPMCGSGTTLVEATTAGRVGLGTDVNPIACLAAAAKTLVLSPASARHLLNLARAVPPATPHAVELPEFPNRSHWFEDHVAFELAVCKSLVESASDRHARLVAMSCFSALIVGVSNQESETRWAARPKDIGPGEVYRQFRRRIESARQSLAEFAATATSSASVVRSDARRLPFEDESADLIVTSPPYANSHDYYLYNKLRMFWLGFDVRAVQDAEIGSRNKHSDKKHDIESYEVAMSAVLAECRRCLKPTGHAAIVVADAVIRGSFFDMGVAYTRLAEGAGLTPVEHVRFSHKPFTSAFQRGFGTAQRKQTHVLVFAAA